jgi:2-aminoadipate transaminase
MKSVGLSALGRRTMAPPISWLMETALAQPDVISLAAGFTDHESLPVAEALEAFSRILGAKKSGRAALQYGTTAGNVKLRQLSAARVRSLDRATREEAYSAANLILTSGSQQMLYMLTEALCDPGDIVLVEDPSYFVYLGILQSHGIGARGIPMQPDGLDLVHLEAVLERVRKDGSLPRVKLLYSVSYYQNPSGITTGFEKKQGALDLLRYYERKAGHPIYLVEDAAYRELRFEGADVKSALAVPGRTSRVIYAGTYSKPFATGARVGFGLLPQPVRDVVLRIKGNHDFGSPSLLQHLLATAIESGAYTRHLAQLRECYRRKAKVMLASMREAFPSSEWLLPRGGLYFWARLPQKLASGMKSKLFQAALANRVLYVPGELCYANDPIRPKPNHEMRLSFGGETEKNIRHGIERLGEALGSMG